MPQIMNRVLAKKVCYTHTKDNNNKRTLFIIMIQRVNLSCLNLCYDGNIETKAFDFINQYRNYFSKIHYFFNEKKNKIH